MEPKPLTAPHRSGKRARAHQSATAGIARRSGRCLPWWRLGSPAAGAECGRGAETSCHDMASIWTRVCAPSLAQNRGLAGEPAVHRGEAELGRVIAGLARRRNAFQRLRCRPASKHNPEKAEACAVVRRCADLERQESRRSPLQRAAPLLWRCSSAVPADGTVSSTVSQDPLRLQAQEQQ
jgi:hypothetical protein